MSYSPSMVRDWATRDHDEREWQGLRRDLLRQRDDAACTLIESRLGVTIVGAACLLGLVLIIVIAVAVPWGSHDISPLPVLFVVFGSIIDVCGVTYCALWLGQDARAARRQRREALRALDEWDIAYAERET